MNKEYIEQRVIDCLSDLYHCSRGWEAWNYKVMTREDFSLARNDDNIVSAFTDMIIEIISYRTERIEAALDKACVLLDRHADEDLIADYCKTIRNSGADCWKSMLLVKEARVKVPYTP